jgi:hypothetical protein
MNSIEEIKQLAQERLEDAKILLVNGRYDSAFYLAGYCVELMLKAKICEHLDLDELFLEPNSEQGLGEIRKIAKTHDFMVLLNLCGLGKKFNLEKSINSQFDQQCSLLFNPTNGWNERVRYKNNFKDPKDVLRTISFLKDTKNGLLQWIENN